MSSTYVINGDDGKLYGPFSSAAVALKFAEKYKGDVEALYGEPRCLEPDCDRITTEKCDICADDTCDSCLRTIKMCRSCEKSQQR